MTAPDLARVAAELYPSEFDGVPVRYARRRVEGRVLWAVPRDRLSPEHSVRWGLASFYLTEAGQRSAGLHEPIDAATAGHAMRDGSLRERAVRLARFRARYGR